MSFVLAQLASDRYFCKRSILADAGVEATDFDQLKKTHSRKYRTKPQGYPPPETISKLLIASSLSPNNAGVPSASLIVMHAFTRLPEYPWYFLNKGLARDLTLTRCPETIPDRIVLPPCGLIVLPNESLTIDNGSSIRFIGYKLFEPYEEALIFLDRHENGKWNGHKYYQLDFGVPDSYSKLFWFAPDDFGVMLGGVVGLRPRLGALELVAQDLDKALNPPPEFEDTSKALSLLLNCLIYSSAVSLSVSTEGKSKKGFSQKSATVYEPLWLGKDYQRVREPVGAGSGAKQAIHWRKGHWKRVAIGVGREERAWRWIRPTIVGIMDGALVTKYYWRTLVNCRSQVSKGFKL